MTPRYVAATLVGVTVAFGLFFLMQRLIAGQTMRLRDEETRWALDFVRLKRDEAAERRKRERPKKVERSQAVPRVASVVEKSAAPRLQAVKVEAPRFDPSLALVGGPELTAGADTDVVPLVRVDPRYPSRALARGLEGWVHLRFTVTAQGTTTDIEILDADPKGYFDVAAKSAVQKYKYKPRIESGVPAARPGVELVLSFELEK